MLQKKLFDVQCIIIQSYIIHTILSSSFLNSHTIKNQFYHWCVSVIFSLFIIIIMITYNL